MSKKLPSGVHDHSNTMFFGDFLGAMVSDMGLGATVSRHFWKSRDGKEIHFQVQLTKIDGKALPRVSVKRAAAAQKAVAP